VVTSHAHDNTSKSTHMLTLLRIMDMTNIPHYIAGNARFEPLLVHPLPWLKFFMVFPIPPGNFPDSTALTPWSRDSAVGIAIGYGLDEQGV
jgi:hypothetical protein